jgi:uncharacterized membrane protein (GlpM family)
MDDENGNELIEIKGIIGSSRHPIELQVTIFKQMLSLISYFLTLMLIALYMQSAYNLFNQATNKPN